MNKERTRERDGRRSGDRAATEQPGMLYRVRSIKYVQELVNAGIDW